MKQCSEIVNLAFYRFFLLQDLKTHRTKILDQGKKLGLKGTVILAPEGVNGFLAGIDSAIRIFQDFLSHSLGWKDLEYRESYSNQVPFRKFCVKLKKQIIPSRQLHGKPQDQPVTYLSPETLKTWLDQKRDFSLLDTRNDYEVSYGTFDQSVHLNLKHFRDFEDRLFNLAPDLKKKPLVMFCTGGIRCEKAGRIAQQQGFEEVYQLEGGILKYFEQCGGQHYQGTCFVFDERVALDPSLKPLD